MSEPRRYDGEQTARILRCAMELRPPVPARVGELARGEGIALDQLVEAAAEAGMEVDAVRRAAAEIDAPEALRTSPFYGAPTRVVEERRIRRAVDATEFDAFVDEVRHEFGMLGLIVAVGGLMSIAPILTIAAPAVPAGMWMGARRLFRRTYDRRRAEPIRLADRLAARAEEPIR